MEQENSTRTNPEAEGIVERSSRYVLDLLGRALPAALLYHDATHTRDVVRGVLTIGMGSGLDGEQMEIVTLAAWFHDVGYTEVYAGHEERGAAIAERFLREEGYPEEKIAGVVGCILATRMPQRPVGLIQEVICDADLSHLATTGFRGKNDLLRREWEVALDKKFSDPAWTRYTVEFLAGIRYHTSFARKTMGEGLAANLLMLEAEAVAS